MKKLTALREVGFGIEFDRERQACRSHGGVCLRRQQAIIEVPINSTEHYWESPHERRSSPEIPEIAFSSSAPSDLFLLAAKPVHHA